ncbi:DUF5123 domain-containing protein [Flavobacterium sp. WC2509]|uniref:DUF5123 domain-containing protein n=1 Tax=Flavobacterium sp. WC2509 TaxID=3461406 RepID=UPI0040448B90
MNIKYILKGLIASLILILAITSCESYNEPLLDSLGNTREFSPLGLKAAVRAQTNVELNWTVDTGVDHYVIEFSADDPNFTTIYKTVEVTASQLPVLVKLEGETNYSIRVKAVTPGLEDSKYAVTTASTLSEQLFLPIVNGDIQAKQATLRWVPNSNVTNIFISPGSISHLITPAEKANGIATITGLSSETNYTATLYNSSKVRGKQTFTTEVDPSTGIVITPADDLIATINNAASGAKLYLESGDYTAQSGLITLAKTITIRALKSYDKPKVKLNFLLNSGVVNFTLIDLDLTGSGFTNPSVITISSAATFNDLLISGCYIHDYSRSLFANTATTATSTINSLTIDNSIIRNVNTNGGAEFIDVRFSYIKSIVLQNSTFDTCSDSREFIRLDAVAAFTGTSNVSINSCTLYKVCTTVAAKRILYLRFASNTSTVKNTLIAETPTALYSNQNGTSTPTTPPTFIANNYFNANALFTPAVPVVNTTTLDKSSFTTLDPKFVDAATGNLKVQNQTIIDNKTGDPRWLK